MSSSANNSLLETKWSKWNGAYRVQRNLSEERNDRSFSSTSSTSAKEDSPNNSIVDQRPCVILKSKFVTDHINKDTGNFDKETIK